MKLLYICKDGQTVEGPLPADQVWRMARSGQIDPATLTALADNPDQWIPLQDVPDDAYSEELLATVQKSNAKDATDEAIGQGCLAIIFAIMVGIAVYVFRFL